jgi:hypothetical protein
MRNFNQFPPAESEVSEETLMDLILAAQGLAREYGSSGRTFEGVREVWVQGEDEGGSELNIEILAYDHSLSIPEHVKEAGLILEVNTSKNHETKLDGRMTWENHDYDIFELNGELAIRKKVSAVASDDPDIIELYRQGRIFHMPSAPEHVRRAHEEAIENEQRANDLAAQFRLNVPTEKEIQDLTERISNGKIEQPKALPQPSLTDEEIVDKIRRRLSSE